jgi:hypothetical protein
MFHNNNKPGSGHHALATSDLEELKIALQSQQFSEARTKELPNGQGTRNHNHLKQIVVRLRKKILSFLHPRAFYLFFTCGL